jgi:hypothetical protein
VKAQEQSGCNTVTREGGATAVDWVEKAIVEMLE